MNGPLRFEPYLRPVVWGGRGFADVLGLTLPTPEPYGEAWLISDHASHLSALVGDGRTLRQLMRDDPLALIGERSEVFPWLVKYVDAHGWLSVQVHPDDESARKLWPGERGKTEAWFVLSAKPGSRAYAGLKAGVGEAALRRALARGAVADCLHSFEPRAGDCLFLPAGTVHAVGGGVLIAEVQQTSDATFRLYDWDRLDAEGKPRRLHIEEALACIDWKAGPVSPIRAAGYPQAGETAALPARQPLVQCPFFDLEYVRQAEPFALPGGRMKVVLVLHGGGEIRAARGPEALKPRDAVLLPACLGETWIHPSGTIGLLISSMPERPATAPIP